MCHVPMSKRWRILLLCGETVCLKSTVEGGLCVLLQNPASSAHLCEKGAHLWECVCACVRCQTAPILVSQTGRRAGEARQSFEVLFSPPPPHPPKKVRSALRKLVMPFHLSDSRTLGVRAEGYLFPFAADISIDTWAYRTGKKGNFCLTLL